MYKVANFNNLPIKGDMTDDLSAKHTKLWINAIVSSISYNVWQQILIIKYIPTTEMKDKKSNDIISEFKRKIENRVKLKYLKFKKDNMQVKWSTIPPISN